MLLIYSEQLSPRLQYICRYLFEERMGVPVSITTDAAVFSGHRAPAICYATQNIHPSALHIGVQGLLFESGISRQEEDMISWEELPAFFPVAGAGWFWPLLLAAGGGVTAAILLGDNGVDDIGGGVNVVSGIR